MFLLLRVWKKKKLMQSKVRKFFGFFVVVEIVNQNWLYLKCLLKASIITKLIKFRWFIHLFYTVLGAISDCVRIIKTYGQLFLKLAVGWTVLQMKILRSLPVKVMTSSECGGHASFPICIAL